MGHEYVDLVDIMLELGLKTEDDGRFTDLFCNKLGIGYDNKTYQKFYELQIRKKLAELLISYIKEVYLYDSFRYQKIFFIADTFSQCYKRFCSIDIFKKNEPIEKEFNQQLKIKKLNTFKTKPFIRNNSNNNGNIDFDTNFDKFSTYKISKIKINSPATILQIVKLYLILLNLIFSSKVSL